MPPRQGASAVNQQAIFDALEGEHCKTLAELTAATGIPRNLLSPGASGLVRRGLVDRVEAGCFRLTDAGRAAKAEGMILRSGRHTPVTKASPKRGGFRARLWRAMRICRRFTVPALLVRAATGEEKYPSTRAAEYLRFLAATGYVRVLTKRAPNDGARGLLRYELLRDTGPLHPIVRNKTELYDPNTGEARPCAIG